MFDNLLPKPFISRYNKELSCYDRLHNDAYTRASNRTVNKKLLDALKDKSYISKPQSNKKGKYKFNLNMAQRPQNPIKNKIALSKQMIEEAKKRDDAELTFHPKISESSKDIVLRKFPQSYSSAPVGVRLYEMSKKKDIEPILSLKFTQEPSDDTTRITKKSIVNFLRRVEISEYFKKKKMSIIKANTESDMTFKPRITMSSQKILACDPSRFCETMDERIDRLAIQDVKKREIARTLVSKQFQYDFQPKISRISIKLAKIRSEKAKNDPKRELKKEESNSFSNKEEQTQPELEFKDKINTKYSYLKSDYKDPKEIMANINNNRQRKTEELEMRKEQESQKELSQCTFQPEIKSKDLKHLKASKSQIKGLGRFYELKSMAIRQHEEEKERIDKAFAYSRS